MAKVVVNGSDVPMTDPTMAGGFYCFAVNPGDNTIEVLFKETDPTAGVVTVKNNTAYAYELQSFTYAGAPTDYKVIENGEIVPGASIFGAIVISVDTPVSVVVNGTPTSVNIPAGGVVFYCFSVKEAGEFKVEINPAQ